MHRSPGCFEDLLKFGRNESGHLCLHVAKVDHHTPNLFYIRLKQNQLVSKGCDEGVQQLDRGTESRHLLDHC